MELFDVSWWTALATIILIDLVLAGDNALVIGMAAGRLRPDLRRRAILWGSAGALIVRAAMALIVVWLLKIPGLLLAGGLLLLPIAYGWQCRPTRRIRTAQVLRLRSGAR
jgi:predicted tellurium resistance membrane protein TerC